MTMKRIGSMLDSHLIKERRKERSERQREREKQYREEHKEEAKNARLKRREFDEQARRDWRVKDKVKVLATKLNKKKLDNRDVNLLSEGYVEEMVIRRMAKDGCTALEAVKLLSEEIL